MKKRVWKSLAAVFAMLLLLMIVPNVTSTLAPQEMYGGTVKVTHATPGSLNPMTGYTITEWWHLELVYDRLATYDANMTVKPWLAYNWTVSQDGLTWTLHLVDNASWHDGEPFTAEDVKFTIDYIIDRYNEVKDCALWQDEVEDVESVETPDDYTVVIHLKVPAAYFEGLTLPRLPIIPKHIWKDITKPDEVLNQPPDGPVGSGPFKLVEFRSGEYGRFEAFENYWRGRPYIDGILVKYDITVEGEFMELEKGGVDLTADTLPEFIDAADDSKEPLEVMVNPGLLFWYICPNQRRYPFNLRWFRQALSHAIDKQRIVDTTFEGYGPVAWSEIAPYYEIWYNPNVTKYEFNLARAAEILDEHGFIDTDGDGFREAPPEVPGEERLPLKFKLTNLLYGTYVRTGDIIADDFAKIGIDLKNDPMELAMAGSKINNRDFDLHMYSYTCAPDPSMIFEHHALQERQFYSFGDWYIGNETTWSEFKDLYYEMRQEMNLTKRREIVFEMQEMLANELPRIPICFPNIISIYRTDTFTDWYGPMPTGLAGPYNIHAWINVHRVLRPVGVKAGKWAQYGEINVTWNSNDPYAQQPSNITDMKNTEWFKNTIKTVSGTKITFQSVTHFKDDTEKTKTYEVDVKEGEGNGTLMFTAKDLSLDSSIYTSGIFPPPPSPPYYEWKINEAISREYAGSTRDVNHLNLMTNITVSNASITITKYNLYWDNATGVLCEQTIEQVSENKTTGHITSWSMSFKILETNLWGAGTPLWVYAVVIVVVIAVAGAAVYVLKIRKT